MPQPQILVPSKTDAETSQSFFVQQNHSVSIHCTPNLAVAEEAVVEISLDNETFVDYEDGAIVRLDSAENAIRLYGPAFYKVAKGETTAATAIQLMK